MRRIVIWIAACAAVSALLYWSLTRPVFFSSSDLPGYSPDRLNGEQVFIAGGCTSCHGDRLEGGLELKTEFGTFIVPNISPDPATGIGDWTSLDLVNAMMLGTSPDARHYYPAFPYTSYTRMKVQDVLDLKAYMDTVEPVSHAVEPHALKFPWNQRRGIGLWKMKYLEQGHIIPNPADDAVFERGRYLVEGAGHCGECHTPRDFLGGMRTSHWLAGGPSPDGEGGVPNITPHENGIGAWSVSDITYFLESGFTPDFDTVGGSMVAVQEHTALLTPADREAIAAYLKSIPAIP